MRTLVFLWVLGLFMSVSEAQTTVTQTITSAGTITEFTPGDAIVLRSEGTTEPLRYSLTQRTIVVDENGTPVDVATVHQGTPVIIHYSREGGQMVVSRVVVQKPAVIERQTTTTTTEER